MALLNTEAAARVQKQVLINMGCSEKDAESAVNWAMNYAKKIAVKVPDAYKSRIVYEELLKIYLQETKRWTSGMKRFREGDGHEGDGHESPPARGRGLKQLAIKNECVSNKYYNAVKKGGDRNG